MICAWCKSKVIAGIKTKLTDEEYKTTTYRASKANHGMCKQCDNIMRKGLPDTKSIHQS